MKAIVGTLTFIITLCIGVRACDVHERSEDCTAICEIRHSHVRFTSHAYGCVCEDGSVVGRMDR